MREGYLHNAAKRGSIEEVRKAIEVKGIDVDSVVNGDSALTVAIINGKEDVVEYLIGKRAYLGVQPGGFTPLFDAVFYGHNPYVVELLVESGAKTYSRESIPTLERIYARRRRCRRAAAATYVAHAGVFPRDLVRLMAKAVWSTRFEQTWLKGE